MPELQNDIYTHTTSLEALEKMLENGGAIKSLRHISRETPDAELSVEPTILPLRWTMKAREAYEGMLPGKDPNKIFFMKGKYVPDYGNSVITIENSKLLKPYPSRFTLDNEYTTGRKVLLKNKGVKVYVPDASVGGLQERYGTVRFYPKSMIPVPPYTFTDRISAGWRHLIGTEKTAEELSTLQVRKLFGRNARLVGSEALGIAVPGTSDMDVFVPYKSQAAFERAVANMPKKYPELVMNDVSKGRADKKTFTGKVNGRDIDVVFGYGEKAQRFNNAFTQALTRLTPQKREEIIRRKQELRNSWVFPKLRYRLYKKQVAMDLGLTDAYF